MVTLRAGTYNESLVSRRAGSAGSPITVRKEPGGGPVVLTAPGRVLAVSHPFLTFEGLVLDGQYGDGDAVNGTANGLVLRGCEIRRTSRDCIDLGAVSDVVIEGCQIHHCLNATGGRTDAHGVTGSAVRNLVIRDTEIHSFSGDAIQFDPGRALPGWSDVRIERCRLWLAPLPAPENGFPAGTVAGENAIDTKTHATAPRAQLTVVDTVAFGYRAGLITNMAAFNLKERVDAVLDRVTVYDSEIAFRLRGATSTVPEGAHVRVQNAVVYDVDTAVRYEDAIANLRVLNATLGGAVTRPFQAASASGMPEVKNLLLLGTALPSEASGASNLAAPASAFLQAAQHDYHLAPGSPAIDKGETLAEVGVDRDGVRRPQAASYDVGAYEECTGSCAGSSGAGGSSAAGGAGGNGGTTGGNAGAGGTTGGSAGAAAGGASGAGATGGAGAVAAGGSGGNDASGASSDDGGCACRYGVRPRSSALLSLGILLLAFRRRRT
jgi:hypothetical protein